MEKMLCLLLILALASALKQKREPIEWDYRSEVHYILLDTPVECKEKCNSPSCSKYMAQICKAEKVNMRGCANLTTVLDNWKFAIMTQFRNLLLYDHHTVLPDYGRIKSLSEALDDLYKEFNALKERLGALTTKFDGVEAFVDEMNAGRHLARSKASPTVAPALVPALRFNPGILSGAPKKVKKPKAAVNQS